MKIHHLKPAPGAHQPKTRKGRGEAAGKGKTAGRGTKGSGARKNTPAGFEGGQMPLQRRLPKLPGFGVGHRERLAYETVNLDRLERVFDDGTVITPDLLRDRGLVRRGDAPVKVLGNGELTKRLTVSAHAFSASAQSKIAAGGGSTTVLAHPQVQRRADRRDPARARTPRRGA
jgi:large subunit ribosomal protein L15